MGWLWKNDDSGYFSSSSGDVSEVVKSQCHTEEVEPGKFIRKCEKTEQIFKDCLGRPSEMVESNKEYTEEDVTYQMVKGSFPFESSGPRPFYFPGLCNDIEAIERSIFSGFNQFFEAAEEMKNEFFNSVESHTYSINDFKSMRLHQEPEIRKVHLGVAILKIIALGVKNVQEFDFVDAPSAGAIDMAIRNLIHVGAIAMNNDVYELTTEGRKMVKLGVDPQLGRLILQCFREVLGKEGLVLAAVMANYSSIFCRVGTEENKLKSDRLKVPFCHPNGALFTLLAVYQTYGA